LVVSSWCAWREGFLGVNGDVVKLAAQTGCCVVGVEGNKDEHNATVALQQALLWSWWVGAAQKKNQQKENSS
jgi:hypothetical protein